MLISQAPAPPRLQPGEVTTLLAHTLADPELQSASSLPRPLA